MNNNDKVEVTDRHRELADLIMEGLFGFYGDCGDVAGVIKLIQKHETREIQELRESSIQTGIEFSNYRNNIAEIVQELRRERDNFRDALDVYGEHLASCNLASGNGEQCDCGLEVLTKPADGGEG